MQRSVSAAPALLDIAIGRMQESSQCESQDGYRLQEESKQGEAWQPGLSRAEMPCGAVHILCGCSCKEPLQFSKSGILS